MVDWDTNMTTRGFVFRSATNAHCTFEIHTHTKQKNEIYGFVLFRVRLCTPLCGCFVSFFEFFDAEKKSR